MTPPVFASSVRLPVRIAGLFTVAYLGFLTHLVLEALFLLFTKDALPADELQAIVVKMSSPLTAWLSATVSLLTLLPVVLALTAGRRAGWRTVSVVGGFVTLLHATHYAGDLAKSGALGVLSLVIHVVPSAWATVLARRFVPAAAA